VRPTSIAMKYSHHDETCEREQLQHDASSVGAVPKSGGMMGRA
jgi:hypothetical protein